MRIGGRIIVEIGGHGNLGDSVVNAIVEAGNYKIPIQTTTREQRNEDDNYFYEFVTEEAFNELIENNEMFEYLSINGILWGTTMSAINDLLRRGEDVFIRIGEYSTALTLKQQYVDNLFLIVVDMEELSDDKKIDNHYEECKKCADYIISRDFFDQDNRMSEDNLGKTLKKIETKAKHVVSLMDEKVANKNNFYKNAIYHVATYLFDKQIEGETNVNMCGLTYRKNIERVQKKIGKLFTERTVIYMYLYIRYLDRKISKEEVEKYLSYQVTLEDVSQMVKCAENISYGIYSGVRRKKLPEFLE